MGLLLMLRTKSTMPRIITVVLAAAIGITFIPNPLAKDIGFYAYMVALIGVAHYALYLKNRHVIEKGTMVATAFLALLTLLFFMQHLPGAYWLGMISVIPALVFLLLYIRNPQHFRNEIGFMVIVLADIGIQAALRMGHMVEKLLG